MKPTKAPRVIPEGSRQYWSLDLTGKGAHHFKAPYYGVGHALLQFAARYHVDPATDTRTLEAKVVAMLPCMGAVIGACWRHRGLDLDAVLPLADLTSDALAAYGVAVAQELQDADYDLLDLLDLFNAVQPEITRRQDIVEMAARHATFTPPPQDASTTSSPS
jgi:hypothetical protein